MTRSFIWAAVDGEGSNHFNHSSLPRLAAFGQRHLEAALAVPWKPISSVSRAMSWIGTCTPRHHRRWIVVHSTMVIVGIDSLQAALAVPHVP